MNRFCSNCGNELTEGVKYCSKCGASVGGESNNKETVIINNYNNPNSNPVYHVPERNIAMWHLWNLLVYLYN